MALFTDVDVITLDDLVGYESTLIQVSTAHGIDVASKIRIAATYIGDKLLLGLLRAGKYIPTSNSGYGLQSVIVTPALQRWLCFEALARTFFEAYNLQLNTRYQAKWNEYVKQAEQACSLVTASGLPVVARPLPRPGLPLVIVGQGAISAPAIFVQTAWTNASGQESALSIINGTVLNGFASVSVQIVGSGLQTAANAAGWNVYAGNSQDQLTLQNAEPLTLNAIWQMPHSGVVVGAPSSGGQSPDGLVVLANGIQRG